eukprot:CFRG6850T1
MAAIPRNPLAFRLSTFYGGQNGGSIFSHMTTRTTSSLFDRTRRSTYTTKTTNTNDNVLLELGGITHEIVPAASPLLVPAKYLPESNGSGIPQHILKHLRWMLQKDKLGQDIFLIGAPGSQRRRLVMQFCELTQREVEYVSLSRDTTESDLKQRREIKSSTAYYVDQAAVRAAISGRVLVLDGIEKAERNVLPVLNNLLENREMRLESGGFLVHPTRFDTLLETHTPEELEAAQLIRVSEHFRVIALGLPVPTYAGNPLDPPLRSRFQSRNISEPLYGSMVAQMEEIGVSNKTAEGLVSLATTVREISTSTKIPKFPFDALPHVSRMLTRFKSLPHTLALEGALPSVIMDKSQREMVSDLIKRFVDAKVGESVHNPYSLIDVTKKTDSTATAHFKGPIQEEVYIDVPFGNCSHTALKDHAFYATPYHNEVLSTLIQRHAQGDVCVLGGRGVGKSAIVEEMARKLHYRVDVLFMYADMTARDLLQHRATKSNGDTVWRPSPVITAAKEGHMLVLDGIHNVNTGTLTVLQRLIDDRELSLYDGTRLIRHDRYEHLMKQSGLDEKGMSDAGIFAIHPSFRIVALAEPPSVHGEVNTGSSKRKAWLNDEVMTMFQWVHMRDLTTSEEMKVIQSVYDKIDSRQLKRVVDFSHSIREATDHTALSISSSLTLRQLLRICHRLQKYPNEDLHHSIQSACLSTFLPSVARDMLDKLLLEAQIVPNTSRVLTGTAEEHFNTARDPKTGQLEVRYQDICMPVKELTPADQVLVPDVVFYDNAQHTKLMSEMLKDYELGEHILLVGNQGVGKNKVVDRFLQVMNRPREYVQLHRDTTVQSLTLQPSIKDGVIVYEDSPLVLAVTHGRTLVVDEADKAPTHVTGILKSLAESGFMRLSDGREIVPTGLQDISSTHTLVPIHPDFRLIVLANRPGFPFLGHDFFSALGDVFSCYSLDNADVASEMAMLRKYGPNVPESVLKSLTAMFRDLRMCVMEGSLNYPYSTRELVHIVRHLEEFPRDGLPSTIRNVFDFDSYDDDVKNILGEVLSRHGVPLTANPGNVFLTDEFPIPPLSEVDTWCKGDESSSVCQLRSGKLRTQGPWTFGQAITYKSIRNNLRESQFSELMYDVQMTMPKKSSVVACAGSEDNQLHVVTINPAGLYTFTADHSQYSHIDLSDLYFQGKGPQDGWSMHPLSGKHKGKVCITASQSDTMALIDTNNRSLRVARLSEHVREDPGDDDSVTSKVFGRRKKSNGMNDAPLRMKPCGGDPNKVVIHREGSSTPTLFDFATDTVHGVQLPFKATTVQPLSSDVWLLQQNAGDKVVVHTLHTSDMNAAPTVLSTVQRQNEDAMAFASEWQGRISTKTGIKEVAEAGKGALASLMSETSSQTTSVEISRPTVFASAHAMFQVANPITDFVYNEHGSTGMSIRGVRQMGPFIPTHSLMLSAHGQIVHLVLPKNKAAPPHKDKIANEETHPQGDVSGYLEVFDLNRLTLKSIPMPAPPTNTLSNTSTSESVFGNWGSNESETESEVLIGLVPNGNEGVVTVSERGRVCVWETRHHVLQKGLEQWTYMLGDGSASGNTQLELKYRHSGKDVEGPKVGKVDETGNPHVGGNTWAGGTGGRDTAGLGGKGGPYRLDAGHEVHQLSQQEKDDVPEHVKKAAREMGQRAFQERLEEINMSQYDADKYNKHFMNVTAEVTDLRRVLQSLEAKKHERVWLKNESTGDLDDNRLIDGVAGESNVYKRRGEQPPMAGEQQQNPKRIRFVMDLSGSMYRFNGFDGRLNRMIDCACMIMESFDNNSESIRYEIYGHSGEEAAIPLVLEGSTPSNEKERLQVLETMSAHAQFCMSGDNTLAAASMAIDGVTEKPGDEHFVMILSDANLEIYGIHPKELGKVLASNDEVTASAIFLGSLGDQADRLQTGLGRGRGFVCMDTKDLPKIMRGIFQNTLLKSS